MPGHKQVSRRKAMKKVVLGLGTAASFPILDRQVTARDISTRLSFLRFPALKPQRLQFFSIRRNMLQSLNWPH